MSGVLPDLLIALVRPFVVGRVFRWLRRHFTPAGRALARRLEGFRP